METGFLRPAHGLTKACSALLLLACAFSAPAFAQDRTCTRMKALTVAAMAGFPNLSGPVVEQGPTGTVITPTQDVVPMVGYCRLHRPSEAGWPSAALSCETPLKENPSPHVAKEAGVLASEFGKCLGVVAQKQQSTGPHEPGSSRIHTWVLKGSPASPWELKLSVVEPDSRGGEAGTASVGRFMMHLTSQARNPSGSK